MQSASLINGSIVAITLEEKRKGERTVCQQDAKHPVPHY